MNTIDATREQIMAEINLRRQELSSSPASSIVLAEVISTQKDENLGSNVNNGLQQTPRTNLVPPREELKNKKIKKLNNCSRDLRGEQNGSCLRPGIGEEQTAFPQILIVEENVSGLGGDSVRGVPNQTFVGINAQQLKSTKGIKVSLTMQTVNDAEFGAVFKVTGELKRADRLRELKPYDGDSEEFAETYHRAKMEIRELDQMSRDFVCMGRVHESGKRAAWCADMCLVGSVNSAGVLLEINLLYNNETYNIPMIKELSPNQTAFYLSAGLYGKLISAKIAPTIHSMKRVAY